MLREAPRNREARRTIDQRKMCPLQQIFQGFGEKSSKMCCFFATHPPVLQVNSSRWNNKLSNVFSSEIVYVGLFSTECDLVGPSRAVRRGRRGQAGQNWCAVGASVNGPRHRQGVFGRLGRSSNSLINREFFGLQQSRLSEVLAPRRRAAEPKGRPWSSALCDPAERKAGCNCCEPLEIGRKRL